MHVTDIPLELQLYKKETKIFEFSMHEQTNKMISYSTVVLYIRDQKN